jgi:hypothetical protein
MLDFKPLIPTFSRREKELFEFLEIPISIYTTFQYNKNNGLPNHQAPSPAGWGDDCMDAGGRATHGAVAEENKINCLYPPHPDLLPQGRRGRYLCRYLCIDRLLTLRPSSCCELQLCWLSRLKDSKYKSANVQLETLLFWRTQAIDNTH